MASMWIFFCANVFNEYTYLFVLIILVVLKPIIFLLTDNFYSEKNAT